MRHLPHIHISVVSGGAVLTLVGTFLTWIRSGATGRSSYELFAIVDRLGFSPDGAVGWSLRLWPLVPLLLALTAVSWWHPSPRRALRIARAAVGLSAAVYAGAVALAVGRAPDAGLLRTGAGTTVTLIGAVVIVAGVAWAELVHRPRPLDEEQLGDDAVTPR